MKQEELLAGKKILVVDDEPDILDTVEDLLPMCEVVKASTFEEAKRLLETQHFDIAILDIMGVNGYELLEIAKKKNIIAVMLTAHSLTVQDTKKSFELGAASFIPKDKIMDIAVFLTDILEGQKKARGSGGAGLIDSRIITIGDLGQTGRKKTRIFGKNSSTSIDCNGKPGV